MSIWQNIFMGAERVRAFLPGIRILDKGAMREKAATLLASLNQNITDMDRPVSELSGGQRQAVAIARALLWRARIIIMDAPTAALGVKETAEVLALIGRLKDAGATVILISHNMEDVVAVADHVVILKSGRKVAESETGGLSAHVLGQAILSGAMPTVH